MEAMETASDETSFVSFSPLTRAEHWTGTEQPWPFDDTLPEEIDEAETFRTNATDDMEHISQPMTATRNSAEHANEGGSSQATSATTCDPTTSHGNHQDLINHQESDTKMESHPYDCLDRQDTPSREITGPYFVDSGRYKRPTYTSGLPPTHDQAQESTEQQSRSRQDDSQVEGEDDLFMQYAPKYELRPQGRIVNSSFTSTWIDQDNTGNYDSEEEERQLRAKRNQVRLRRRVDSVADHSSEGSNGDDDISAPHEPRKLVTRLPFTTASGRLALYSILNKPPARHEAEIDHFSIGYRLRSQAASAAEPKQSRNAEHGLPEDLTGHPIARGCWGCLDPGKDDCPLLEYEHTYPCHACLESSSECELIIPPTSKRVCESCKRRRRTCSYTYNDLHNEPCLDCADDGFHCVAGPAKDTIRSRIRYDAPPIVKKAAPAKVYWTCQQCQEAGRNCSFTSNGQSVPDCTACEMDGVICVPKQSDTKPQPGKQEMARKAEERRKKRVAAVEHDKEPPSKSKKTGVSGKEIANKQLVGLDQSDTHDILRQEAMSGRNQSHIEQRTAANLEISPRGRTRTITTRFSHPILFNNTATAANGICDFCDGSSFALLGFEPKAVEVIDWQDGRGLTEVSGGHMGEGMPSTRMCIVCTMHRCNIITCQDHSLRKLPNADKLLQRAGAALTDLFTGMIQKKDKWCSLCPSLASYKCETGTVDSHGWPCLGCGLLLCETCMVYLGVADGDLQKMLAGMRNEPSDERPLGMRADIELLKPDGSLVRHMMWLSEQEEASSKDRKKSRLGSKLM
ncbi:hypothetical protein LTR78_004928 [Recurvomyces mirabilis]|uniref:Zn(2)-C6 fungal-type domain-containing protein n=1 Tax=Recurvomyces mirabilis TaxID=574656 RepID=A0AAE0WNC7_9PEZI|nr:hypothetical protein LTR78_004928 [Recurvomyces mirabilis]KAK5158455.1 hypothetical protein LTS14_003474 [Recurvomyces mirabilis]